MNIKVLFLVITLIHSGFLALSGGFIYVSADHEYLSYSGRVNFAQPKKAVFSYPGVSVTMKFKGSSCILKLENDSKGKDQYGKPMKNYLNVFIDGNLTVVAVENGTESIMLGSSLPDTIHTVSIHKRTEAMAGNIIFKGFLIFGDSVIRPDPLPVRKIEFIGNSITCGYGNEGENQDCHYTPATQNNYTSYAAITARALNAQYTAVAYSGKGVLINYDKSESENMRDLYLRVDPHDNKVLWDFKKWQPDVVVINLGTNDFAHTAPDSAAFVEAYLQLLRIVRTNNPKTSIFCITGPMINDNWPAGIKAKTRCSSYIQAAIKQLKGGSVYFFEMSTQGSFGFGCDYHPNLKQHQKNAEELSNFISEKMNWR